MNKIKCIIGAASAKTETECATGTKNCKSVTVTTSGIGVATHSCGNSDANQKLECTETSALVVKTNTCYCKGPAECSASPKQMIINQVVIFLALAAILGTQY